MEKQVQSAGNNAWQEMRQIATNSLRYWEWLRIPYNILLFAITVFHIAPAAWHRTQESGLGSQLIEFALLAIIANLLYCLAYIPDVFAQISFFREHWLRWRWLLFVLGCGIASLFAFNIAK